MGIISSVGRGLPVGFSESCPWWSIRQKDNIVMLMGRMALGRKAPRGPFSSMSWLEQRRYDLYTGRKVRTVMISTMRKTETTTEEGMEAYERAHDRWLGGRPPGDGRAHVPTERGQRSTPDGPRARCACHRRMHHDAWRVVSTVVPARYPRSCLPFDTPLAHTPSLENSPSMLDADHAPSTMPARPTVHKESGSLGSLAASAAALRRPPSMSST